MGTYDVNSFDPCGLDLEITYYWRVDEVGDFNTYKGNVWSFTTMYPVEPNLLSWWKFDEGQGNIAYDSAGDNDGTIYGAAWTAGKIGNWALDFDGYNDYVETNNGILDLPMDDHTIAVWVKINNKYSSGIIIHTGVSQWLQISYSSSARKIYGQWQDGVLKKIVESDSTDVTGMWKHIVTRRNGSEYSMFIDGVKQNDTKAVGNDFQAEGNIFIGKAGSTYFDGTIDDMRIYERALSDQEIWELYQDGLN